MSGNQTAGVPGPPTEGTNAPAPGAAADVADLAVELGAEAAGGGDESSGEESAPKPVAPPRMRIAASPGMEKGAEVRVRLAKDRFGVAVVAGQRNFDGPYPVAGCFDSGQNGPAVNLVSSSSLST